MANPYFGQRWDVPATDGAVQVPTPVGVPCGFCEMPTEEGDRGFMLWALRLDDDDEPRTEQVPWHRECLLVSTSGHVVGCCACGGEYDTDTPTGRRLMALVAWDKFAALRG